jgi:hypothetical protein
VCAYAAALAKIIVDLGQVVSVEFNAGVGTVDPAYSAFRTFFKVDNRSEGSP